MHLTQLFSYKFTSNISRAVFLGGLYVREMLELGMHQVHKVKYLGFVLKEGKMNQGSRVDVAMCTNHVNPVLDTVGWLGATLMYRYVVMKETCSLDDIDYLYETMMLRQQGNRKESVHYRTQYNAFRNVFEMMGISTKAVTHAGRFYEQARQYKGGVNGDVLKRWTRRIHNPEDDNYLHFVPTAMNLAIGAGGCGDNLHMFCVPRMAALQTMTDEQTDMLIEGLLPNFVLVSYSWIP